MSPPRLIHLQPVVAPPARPAASVPFFDLSAQTRALEGELTRAMRAVAQSGVYVLGPRVAAFEEAFAAYVGARYCVGVNSGTSALHLALICAGVKPGDEVITTPMSFVATSWAISYVGATPVFVDVDPTTYTLDPGQVERKITARTRAIVPVHLYGQPADLGPLLELGQTHGIPVVEDAAQAHGARLGSKAVGTLGLCGCFSFYPGKNLGAFGEAGAVTTNDPAIASRLRSLRNHAQTERYHHAELGFNARMDAMQGAILEIKLRRLERWIEARRALARRYQAQLAGLPLQLPVEAAGRRHVWHLFTVLHPQRDRIRRELEARGIETGMHYPVPIHLQPAYAHLNHAVGSFPVSERVANCCLSLPLFPEMTEAQQDRVVQALHEILGGKVEALP